MSPIRSSTECRAINSYLTCLRTLTLTHAEKSSTRDASYTRLAPNKIVLLGSFPNFCDEIQVKSKLALKKSLTGPDQLRA